MICLGMLELAQGSSRTSRRALEWSAGATRIILMVLSVRSTVTIVVVRTVT